MTVVTRTRRRILGLFGATLFSASCAPAIVSRDPNDPFEGGIGGTGIVGTLTGFGSLRINGLRVRRDGRTRYRTPYGITTGEILAPGHVLTIAALRDASGILAREVSVDFALVGVLREDAGRLSVNGVPLIDPVAARGDGAPGTRVAVSGLWTAQGLRPSRIDPAPTGTQDLIAGTVGRSPDGTGTIGGLPISSAATPPASGAYATAFGRANTERFLAERVHSGRFARLSNLRLLSVEGYLEPAPSAPGLRIAGLGHNFATDVHAAAIGDRRALYFGRYTGRFAAARGYLLPENATARARLLRNGIQAEFPGPVLDL